MRTLGLLVLAAAVSADTPADRTLALARAYLKRGLEAVEAANSARTAGQRLHALARADFLLGRADGLAAKAGDLGLESRARVALIDARIRKAAAYYERKSLPSAKETVLQALALDPSNAAAKALLAAIEKAEDEDVFDSVDGVVGIDRVKARRLAAGVPLRDRGVARRR
jgi:hypothetical protein